MTVSPSQSFRGIVPIALCAIGLATGIAVGLWTRVPSDAEQLAQRKSEVEARSAADKHRLRDNHVKFVKLDAAQRARLRQLDDDLASAPDREELRAVMLRYHKWVANLSLFQRDELMKFADDPDKRLHRVSCLAPLSKQDFDKINAWWEERWREQMSENRKQRPELKGAPRFNPDFWRDMTAILLSERSPSKNDRFRPLPLEDYQKLAVQLSATPRQALEGEKTVQDKGQLVGRWIRRRYRPPDFRVPSVTEQDLVDYFAEKLSAKEREELISLPLNERNRKLREKYYGSKFPSGTRPPGPGLGSKSADSRDGRGKSK
jgi:hypothetical protein